MGIGSGSADEERSLTQSWELQDRAVAAIPGGSQTGSKQPSQFVQGVSPSHIARAKGSRLWDPDGNEYIDCNAALGPIILGHSDPTVTEAVANQLEAGTVFTMEHPLQVEVAELVIDMVPCAEKVKFAKNGNDVTTLAAKLARAYTGREVIATQGYHGWGDVWMANGNLDAGIPEGLGEKTAGFSYNDIESAEAIFEEHEGDVAAIVTTPVNNTPPEDGFLEELRELADREDALLVFDEVLTGFRSSLGGAQERYGVTPDLACFAKAMANGYPLSALAGRADVMDGLEGDGFFYSMTNAGEAASLAASEATLTTLRDEPVHEEIREIGEQLKEGIADLIEDAGLTDVATVGGFPQRFSVGFTDEADISVGEDESASRLLQSLFMQEAHERGVLYTGSHMPTYSHTEEDVELILEAYGECYDVVAEAIEADAVADRLRGEPIGAGIRERIGGDA